ncbi:hypothetical protein AAC03nite_23360 [Alicyclobacillus acidoterrestris]|uniref:sensor histidine kinase n=1 Tax=Alicyclobacillus suci TaxID=2816080 RepID=UPI00118F8C7C|nr:HAMP domain-containing sensor histidine kinase [Alicyclobacillus suci]GEO26551.1 hypothetical protein AAC03nite_23360 [Alicyclobacillus acidoterrestris]
MSLAMNKSSMTISKSTIEQRVAACEHHTSTVNSQTGEQNLARHQSGYESLRQIICQFFVDMPWSSPFFALLLDANNIILDVIEPRGGLSQLKPLLQKQIGQPYRVSATSAHVPVGSVQPVCVFDLGNDWWSAAAEFSQPVALAHFKLILSIPKTYDQAHLHSMLGTAVYAIERMCSLDLMAAGGRYVSDKGEKLENQLTEFEKNRSLASLSAGIAHEIRNPLTTARGFLQLFEQRCEPEDKEFVELTIRELDRIHTLLQDFMGMARPDDESLEFVDIRDVTYSVYQFLRPEASLCGVLLNYKVPSTCVYLSVQENRIKQVLINLLQNAVHACDKDGVVDIVLQEFADYVTITIRDNGCGISDMHHLFRPFQTTKSNGTGLGMFVSKHIIEAHRGHLQVDSTVGEGTTVTVYLPRS